MGEQATQRAARKLRRQALMESVRAALAQPGAMEEYERWKAAREKPASTPAQPGAMPTGA